MYKNPINDTIDITDDERKGLIQYLPMLICCEMNGYVASVDDDPEDLDYHDSLFLDISALNDLLQKLRIGKMSLSAEEYKTLAEETGYYIFDVIRENKDIDNTSWLYMILDLWKLGSEGII